MVKEIPLTQGKIALVDDDDYDELNKYKWYASCMKGNKWYATRNKRVSEGGLGIVLMHRVIINPASGMEVDHKDGDGLNNQKNNIRSCSVSNNQANRKKSKNRSGYKGVDWFERDRKWRARIVVRGECIHLGLFDIEEDAARAYDEAASKCFGEFALLNFYESGTR